MDIRQTVNLVADFFILFFSIEVDFKNVLPYKEGGRVLTLINTVSLQSCNQTLAIYSLITIW